MRRAAELAPQGAHIGFGVCEARARVHLGHRGAAVLRRALHRQLTQHANWRTQLSQAFAADEGTGGLHRRLSTWKVQQMHRRKDEPGRTLLCSALITLTMKNY